jgi:hypothetical protein
MLPSILLEMRDRSSGGWQTRGIPNKFPALSPEGDTARFVEGICVAMKGFGAVGKTGRKRRQGKQGSKDEETGGGKWMNPAEREGGG